MSCNVDLLHVGIWTFYSGCSLLLASVITYGALQPVEKEILLKERNETQRKRTTQISYSVNPAVKARTHLTKKVNFLV